MKFKFYPPIFSDLLKRLESDPDWIQVVLGPRQVGKSTGVQWILNTLEKRSGQKFHYCTADEELAISRQWIMDQWTRAKAFSPTAILVIDEIQNISNWSTAIKFLWDQQKHQKNKLKVVLLGSSSLKLQEGLKESLTGRFELTRIHHWSFFESNQIKKMSLSEFLKWGGYPGTYSLIEDQERWKKFIRDSIISPIVNEDLLANSNVKKPALFKQCFELLASYPAQEVSYTKLLGQLQDQGNVEIIKHYISLYEAAFLFKTIPKFSTKAIKLRTSAPKIIPLCPALSAFSKTEIEDGRLFEAAVGAELLRLDGELFYWREQDHELDYVFQYRKQIYAIEVKYGKNKTAKGLDQFLRRFPKAIPLLITPENFEKLSKDGKGFFENS